MVACQHFGIPTHERTLNCMLSIHSTSEIIAYLYLSRLCSVCNTLVRTNTIFSPRLLLSSSTIFHYFLTVWRVYSITSQTNVPRVRLDAVQRQQPVEKNTCTSKRHKHTQVCYNNKRKRIFLQRANITGSVIVSFFFCSCTIFFRFTFLPIFIVIESCLRRFFCVDWANILIYVLDIKSVSIENELLLFCIRHNCK